MTPPARYRNTPHSEPCRENGDGAGASGPLEMGYGGATFATYFRQLAKVAVGRVRAGGIEALRFVLTTLRPCCYNSLPCPNLRGGGMRRAAAGGSEKGCYHRSPAHAATHPAGAGRCPDG